MIEDRVVKMVQTMYDCKNACDYVQATLLRDSRTEEDAR